MGEGGHVRMGVLWYVAVCVFVWHSVIGQVLCVSMCDSVSLSVCVRVCFCESLYVCECVYVSV